MVLRCQNKRLPFLAKFRARAKLGRQLPTRVGCPGVDLRWGNERTHDGLWTAVEARWWRSEAKGVYYAVQLHARLLMQRHPAGDGTVWSTTGT
eukprot:6208190-Pleurochrysis_carterae.AAC.2